MKVEVVEANGEDRWYWSGDCSGGWADSFAEVVAEAKAARERSKSDEEYVIYRRVAVVGSLGVLRDCDVTISNEDLSLSIEAEKAGGE